MWHKQQCIQGAFLLYANTISSFFSVAIFFLMSHVYGLARIKKILIVCANVIMAR